MPKGIEGRIDGKWRLTIPLTAAKRLRGRNFFLLKGEGGHVRLYASSARADRITTRESAPRFSSGKIERVKSGTKRLVVPQLLRRESPFAGRGRVRIVGKRSYLELLPLSSN